MIVVGKGEKEKWNRIVRSFQDWDIYYLYEYVESLTIGKDKKFYLLYFEKTLSRMCYTVIVNDISEYITFKDCLENNMYKDMESPYGYGGPLIDSLEENDVLIFKEELKEWCELNNIVSQFIRFNPLLKNHENFVSMYDETRYVHHTIFIDTENNEIIEKNMDSKNRNMVRKAMKNDVDIVIDESFSAIGEFIKIYEDTMDVHNASDMYYLPSEYYTYLLENMKDNLLLVVAKYNGEIISGSLFFYNENNIHYHLSGTRYEYRNLASVNLLLYEVAKWASKKGIKKFHLGGGMREDDSLYGFKKQFNKNGVLDFYIGKTIFDQSKYNFLIEKRKENDNSFNLNNNRMIQYQ